jgi:fatty-acyl-CoA synthase
MSETLQETKQAGEYSPARAWLRALELTAPIAKNPGRTLPNVIDELAEKHPDAPAVLSDRESLSYAGLAARTHQYARWALKQGIAKGDVVCLLMTNRPEYLAIWLGITSVGGVVALLNVNLVGASLAHSIQTVSPKCVVVAAELVESLDAALPHLNEKPAIYLHGDSSAELPQAEQRRIDHAIADLSGAPLSADERRPVGIDDLALYIYTSGTTGLPKAARISHGRILQWSYWFAGMMEVTPADRMYNCLPMYHSVGGVQTPGAMLVAGGSVVLREKFSASGFWKDVRRWDCTLIQYIGELCRYLLLTEPSAKDGRHRLRLACGNGLAPEVWEPFKNRFAIPRILEFYAATEGSVSLFNAQGKTGSIGHIPSYLVHRFAPALVVFDFEKGEPVRNEEGFCIRCAPNQSGEALSKLVDDPANVASRFEGYTSKEANEKKILRDVFVRGDAWFRSGDLMRRDEQGYFYFVDRIGDTFRWKGENVATSEVSAAIGTFPGVKHTNVYGVAVPGTEGRAGMATVVSEDELDLDALRKHLIDHLPPYARPLFLRIRTSVDMTGTFKYSKTELVRQGYDPMASEDELYFDHPQSGSFVPLDFDLYDEIQSGQVRL